MVNTTEWNFTNYKGELPKPENWDDHPEWFDLESGRALRLRGSRYLPFENARETSTWSWGPVQAVYEIGEYHVIEFLWDYSNYNFGVQEQHGRKGYAAWVDGEEVDLVWESLDEAIVDMVRFKYEGQRGSSGPRATEYFIKMVRG
jgi:hypothetical protein